MLPQRRSLANLLRSPNRNRPSILLLFLLAFILTLATPTLATSIGVNPNSFPATTPTSTQPVDAAQTKPQTAEQLFEVGRYQAAIAALQQSLIQARQAGDRVEQAIILSNLSLSHQKLGNWQEAQQTVTEALSLLNGQPATVVQAQALDVRGSLELAQGQTEKAIDTWVEAAKLYQQNGDLNRAAMSQINQAQALQQLGFFKRAAITLSDLERSLSTQPDSLTKVSTLRTLGEALRVVGDLERAKAVMQRSLAIAKWLQSQEAIAQANLSLGNLALSQEKVDFEQDKLKSARDNYKEAIAAYQTAFNTSSIALTRAQAAFNHLNALLKVPAKVQSGVDIWAEVPKLYTQVQNLISTVPPGQASLELQVGLGRNLIRWWQAHPENAPTPVAIARLLATTAQQAKQWDNPRAVSAATGYLGRLYEQLNQWTDAQRLTQEALVLAQAYNTPELTYRWQWQLGRILRAQGQNKDAIAAYTEAFTSLQSLKRDLTAINSDIKFSFREESEPVYRQLVDLLLQTSNPKNLQQARAVMESLQVAELQNFLQSTCQDASLQIDRIVDRDDPTAAVLYPIILENRLEVLVKLPGQQDLYHYPAVLISQKELTATLRDFQGSLQEPYRFKEVQQQGQQLYNWLIQPIEAQLQQRGVKTLVFTLDGALRTIPMAALYDGNQYLVERYAVSLALGLDVREPLPLKRSNLRVLAASLTNPPPGFETYDPLANVNPELDQIKSSGLKTTLIRDDAFTKTEFKQELTQANFQIIHLATHGQFGKDRNQTFILAADGAIRIDELDQLFRAQKQNRDSQLEILILSACKTAAGNDRAVLGIAGTAVKAGAQSAIAGLWTLADEPSVKFTHTLYQFLGQPNVTRAEALRQAQVALLQDPDFSHPRFWAPYVLVGSWF